VQGREAAGVTFIDGGPVLEQQLGGSRVTHHDCENQGCLAFVVPRIDLSALIEQCAQLSGITRARGVMQRSGGCERATDKKHNDGYCN
jgi:hypothetical protein